MIARSEKCYASEIYANYGYSIQWNGLEGADVSLLMSVK